MVCGTCKKDFDLRTDPANSGCSVCSTKYHARCLNLSRDEQRQLRTGKYICPTCKAKKRENGSDSTPCRGSTEKPKPSPEVDPPVCSEPVRIKDNDAIFSLTTTLKQVEKAFSAMQREMCSFTASLNSTTDDILLFRKELQDVKTQLKELDSYKTEVENLRCEVSELRQELAAQKQEKFLKDIEISGITEHKEENLPQIVSVLSVKLGVEMDSQNIDQIRRVGLRGGGPGALERPRPIIVTMTRRAPRDEFLRAARVRRGITTEMLQVPGNSRKVFVNEHLTKENRILFSKARSIGKDLNFKYVWSSNGSIYMRRSETSSILRVSSEAILLRLKKDPTTSTEPNQYS
ncbi:hypothetical protein O3G_MSEX000559 [Manduca sexta]|nr:hypothetical protein O3G_MSEX000559 [Manduca sexta]